MESNESEIIHVDMDAFFAAVEQRDHPELRGRPVVVGGSPDSRGVVSAASYEARAFGVHSAMPCHQAKKLCPRAVFVRARFAAYDLVSRQIRRIFARYTDCREPLSLDEAFLDVSPPRLSPLGRALLARAGDSTLAGAKKIAESIRQDIRRETALTASAGVSYNKFLAKLASDSCKPDGLRVITREDAPALLASLPVERFWGVGRVTATRLNKLGLMTGRDLLDRGREFLAREFGKSGLFLWELAQGIDLRPVEPDRERKSYGRETTFKEDLSDPETIRSILGALTEEVVTGLKAEGLEGQTVTVKARTAEFETTTRSLTMPKPSAELEVILPVALSLLEKTQVGRKPLRLIGVSLAGFNQAGENLQLDLPFELW